MAYRRRSARTAPEAGATMLAPGRKPRKPRKKVPKQTVREMLEDRRGQIQAMNERIRARRAEAERRAREDAKRDELEERRERRRKLLARKRRRARRGEGD